MKSFRFVALLGVFCAFLTGVSFAETTSTAYLVTTSSSINDSLVHIINTSGASQSFTGTLYNGNGTQLGAANKALHVGTIASQKRLILNATDLENLFNVPPWVGPAMLEVTGIGDFKVMIKLKSPSGFISNTNCVTKDSVQNVEGYETSDITFVRFINTGSSAISNITGTLYDKDGNIIGAPNQLLVDSLNPKQQIWIDRWQLYNTFQQEWTSEASLVVSKHPSLKLLNLNFVNSETFFNFSCFENTYDNNLIFSTSELQGNSYQLMNTDYPSCKTSFTFNSSSMLTYPDGTVPYTIINGVVFVPDDGYGISISLEPVARFGSANVVGIETNGGSFVDKTSNWPGANFSSLNNDAAALKDWFISNGFRPGSTITTDGRVIVSGESLVGSWWIEENVFYFAYPEGDCVDYKAYKLFNDRLLFATDADTEVIYLMTLE